MAGAAGGARREWGTAADGPAGDMHGYGADPLGMVNALGTLFSMPRRHDIVLSDGTVIRAEDQKIGIVTPFEFAAEEGAIAEEGARGGVYLLRDAEGKVMRTGRSGDLVRRAAEHARDPFLKDYSFEAVYRTDSYPVQRGLEQMLHKEYAPPLNMINPINPLNPNRFRYMTAAEKFLEELSKGAK